MNNIFEQKIPVSENQKEKIILTGGTEGIGRAIALELANLKYDIVICARTQEKLDEMQKMGKIEAIQLDLGENEKIHDFVEQGVNKLGGLTTLILNAAVTGIRESEEYTKKVVRDAQITLVNSASKMLREPGGRIVFLTSVQSQKLIKGHEHYGQSKRDVEEYLKEFTLKEENKNIHVFFVNPGHVDTRMNEEAINYGISVIKERSIDAKNLGKFRDPNIVGKIISKMSLSGKKFNQETNEYDMPIANNETVIISDENVKFEKDLSSI